MSPRSFTLALAMFLAGAAGATAQNRAIIRFQEMDLNSDHVIARAEWHGSKKSFDVHDWNGDGTLSGDEVRIGASRSDRTQDPDFDFSDREYVFDDWTDRGFLALDHNRDDRLTRDEWHFDRQGFRHVDHNNDGVITRAEFFLEDNEDDLRDEQLPDLDINDDGRISRAEWHGSMVRFNALDDNRDGFLSRTEILGDNPPGDLFTSVDMNRDRAISLDEWHWSRASFDQRDLNHDTSLTLQEFDGTATDPSARSGAYRAGYERGTIDGRQAGRDERLNNRAWDLEGQTELQQADSGYQTGMGSRADFQSGYREGFRRAYREGWGQAK